MEDLSGKIKEKKLELLLLQQLNNQIISMTLNFENMQENMTDLSQGTESISNVMMNWQKILQSISMASLSLQKYSVDDYENFELKKNDLDMPLPETLVRLQTDLDEENN